MTRFWNVASNLLYALAGWSILATGGPFAIPCGSGLFSLTGGSGLFHFFEERIEAGERRFKWAQRADEIGMYLAIVPLQWFALATAFSIPPNIAFILMGLQLVLMVAFYALISSFWALGIMFAVTFLAALSTGSSITVFVALGLLGLAFWLRELHHGFWHIYTAFAYSTIYEAIPKGPPSAEVIVTFICLLSVGGIWMNYRTDGVLHGLHGWYKRWKTRGFTNPMPHSLRPFDENIHRAGSRMHHGLHAAALGILPAMWFVQGWIGVIVGAGWIYAGSKLGSNYRQKMINRGYGLPEVDSNERPESEIGEGIWIPKLFHGKTRFLNNVLGWLLIIGGLAVVIFL